MSVKIIEDMRLARPGCAVTVEWEPDRDHVWDGEGPDPSASGMVANFATVRATEIRDGRIYTGEAHMAGVYAPVGCEGPEDVHGYIEDLVAEAVAELDAELLRSGMAERREMKNTNCKAYRYSVRDYLMPIVAEALEARDLPTDGNLFARIVGVARREVPHEFAYGGTQCGMEYWLSGLGMNIACHRHEILALAQAWHGCELDARQQDTVYLGWFRHLAAKIIQFSSEGGVK